MLAHSLNDVSLKLSTAALNIYYLLLLPINTVPGNQEHLQYYLRYSSNQDGTLQALILSKIGNFREYGVPYRIILCV